MNVKAFWGCLVLGASVSWGLCVLDGSAATILGATGLPASAGLTHIMLGLMSAAATLLISLGYTEERDGIVISIRKNA